MAAAAARQAIERDRSDPVALAIYGHIQAYLLKDYGIATDYLDRAMAVGPSCAVAWGYSSLTRGYLGDYPRGRRARRKGRSAFSRRPGRLLVRAFSVAGLLSRRTLRGRCGVGTHVRCPHRRQRRQPALPDHEPRRYRAIGRSTPGRRPSAAARPRVPLVGLPRTDAAARRGSRCFRREIGIGGLVRVNSRIRLCK